MPEIRIGQGDKDGTTLVANIYDNGEPFTLTNYTVRFAMILPFDMAYYSVVGTVSGNTATFAIDESYAASVAGVTETAYVEVLSGSTVICSTNRIRVVCLESAYENVDPAHLWDNGLNEAIARANAAAEAAEGVVLDALPTMTANIKGGAKLGSGLEVVSDTLSIDLTDEATGESITTADASYLASLTVDGKAVQDGTPTPSAPVEVKVVSPINNVNASSITSGYWAFADGAAQTSDRWVKTEKMPCTGGADYIASGSFVVDYYGFVWFDANGSYISSSSENQWHSALSYTATAPNNAAKMAFNVRKSSDEAITPAYAATLQIESGTVAHDYVPYGSIGLNINDTITPIDLQGNVLASLPDGTKDVLTVDSVGHCVLEKRVGVVNLGNESWARDTTGAFYALEPLKKYGSLVIMCSVYQTLPSSFSFSNYSSYPDGVIAGNEWSINQYFYVKDTRYTTAADLKAALSGVLVYFALKTPQTIDLGYIDMPAIPDGATISITAQVTPTITAAWWARGAAAIGEALKAVRARLQAIEAAIAELATA